MKVREYVLVCRAVEEGVELGWNRAHKHTDEPTPEAVKAAIDDAVMNALTEVFVFDDVDFGD